MGKKRAKAQVGAEIVRLRLRAGDVIVLAPNDAAIAEDVLMAKRMIHQQLPGVPTLVVPPNVELCTLSIDDFPAEFLYDLVEYVARRLAVRMTDEASQPR